MKSGPRPSAAAHFSSIWMVFLGACTPDFFGGVWGGPKKSGVGVIPIGLNVEHFDGAGTDLELEYA